MDEMNDEEDHSVACVPCGVTFKYKSKLNRHFATRKHKLFADHTCASGAGPDVEAHNKPETAVSIVSLRALPVLLRNDPMRAIPKSP